MKKIYALIPSEREKECTSHHMAWDGKMPCTGVYKCMMCGYNPEIHGEEVLE